MRAATAARLVVDPDCKVLDLGCGVGAATFAMAERVGPAGLAAGVDISPALIDVATRRAQGQSGVEFRIGEVTSVPYPDGFFDAAYCERVFLYLPDRLAAIGELQRVVRPGGQVWLVDTDAEATAIYSSQGELTRKLTSLFASAFPNPNSARELPALAKRAGLRDLKVELFAVSTPYRFLVHAMGGVLAQAAARGQTIGDIGGGLGHLFYAVLDRAPRARGVLFDLPQAVEHARRAANPRVSYVGGDFFKDPIPSCDAYMMMMVLHDWSDDESIAILKNIKANAPRTGCALCVRNTGTILTYLSQRVKAPATQGLLSLHRDPLLAPPWLSYPTGAHI
jgi:ubiquinone/menaquinone biosynthesis C-methylase UbiE